MKRFIILLICICAYICLYAQVKTVKPQSIFPVPDITAEQYNSFYQKIDEGKLSRELGRQLEENPIFMQFYSPACSWYCGGVIDTVKASSSLDSYGRFSYCAGNLHDFNHETAWAEGVEGDGIGEYIVYEFPGNCPRITTVNILNGYVKSEALWKANSRIKSLKVYYNNKPLAILELEGSRSLQAFEIGVVGYGPKGKESDKWSLKFEILEVYPGEKYRDTVISDIYFDGIDVH